MRDLKLGFKSLIVTRMMFSVDFVRKFSIAIQGVYQIELHMKGEKQFKKFTNISKQQQATDIDVCSMERYH